MISAPSPILSRCRWSLASDRAVDQPSIHSATLLGTSHPIEDADHASPDDAPAYGNQWRAAEVAAIVAAENRLILHCRDVDPRRWLETGRPGPAHGHGRCTIRAANNLVRVGG